MENAAAVGVVAMAMRAYGEVRTRGQPCVLLMHLLSPPWAALSDGSAEVLLAH
jgi:hypothetical protein